MIAHQLPASFEEALHQHLIFYSRVTCVIAILLIVGGIGLDVAFYPESVLEFARARVFVAGLIGLILWSYRTHWGEKNVRILTYAWIALPQLMIAWMVFQTNGEASIYFVGLTFAISGIGIFLPLMVWEAFGFSVFTLLVYALACMLRAGGVQQWSAFAGQMIFIVFYAVIAVMVSVYGLRQRRQSYDLLTEVQAQKSTLLAQNKALTDIKGQLLQREKMAAIGTLSAGLLHELNNPVNYSLMAINLALTLPTAKNDELLNESLVDARDGMVRIQNIVSDLKTFAYQKAGDNNQRVFLLENAVRSALRLAGHELKGITVVVDMPQDSHVRGDEPAMIGVLINLLSNAAHAVYAAKREQPQITLRGTMLEESPVARVFISVRDNGQGIDPANMGRVFEPFFTTRDVGAGLGLGLSMSYSIVQRHGGTLAVTSELGAWTEFTFDLPRP
jgi:two-component system, sensor histidine kinase PhcS